MFPLLQIFVGICFIGLIIVLFFEHVDYILYSVMFIVLAAVVSAIFIPEVRELTFLVNTIDWEAIFFFIAIFAIVEVLKESHFFEEIGNRIIKRYGSHPRKLFYIFCIVTTLLASVIAGISIVAIFIPLIIIVTKESDINPTPFLLGISVCVNLAATLTPVGSVQNILIADEFSIGFAWFLANIMPYFLITLVITLVSLDQFILKKYLKKAGKPGERKGLQVENLDKVPAKTTGMSIKKNLILLIVFIFFLVLVPEIYLVAIIFIMVFVAFNPYKNPDGRQKKFSLIHYLQKVDYKLIYFFICLFMFIGLMEINGTLLLLEALIESLSFESLLFLSIVILVVTSIFSGLLDNTPVTIMFIPIILILTNNPLFHSTPLLIAFILGINLGGNFLPQGSPADLMVLEMGRASNIKELTYRKMVKIGGSYAILHVLIGIGYLTIITLLL